MKVGRLTVAILAVVLTLPSVALAGAKASTRSRCRVLTKKYACDVQTGCYGFGVGYGILCASHHADCTLAQNGCGPTTCPFGGATAHCQNSASGSSTTMTNTGIGFAGSDPSAGPGPGLPGSYARNDLDSTVVFDEINNRILFTLQNGTFEAANDGSTSILEVTAWVATGDGDDTITLAKTLWSGSLRIHGGLVSYSGNLSRADFQESNSMVPPSGGPTRKATVSNVLKTIPFSPADVENLVVTVSGDVGFGDITLPSIPTLSQWGIFSLVLCLLSIGVFLIGRRRFAKV